MKQLIKKAILNPPFVKWCSQTIYQSLLGCIKLYEFTSDSKWKFRADDIFEILYTIQQEDGGYDIGYDFNFGLLHKKGESTSPEMIGLLATVEYGRVFGFNDKVRDSCDKSINWIKKYAINCGDEGYYIPYAPYSTSNVMVYNGTSFVCGALGYYLGILNITNDSELICIYNGMVKYLDINLLNSDRYLGRFWPYYDQKRTDIKSPQKDKIDNYHQMQQVEMHSYAERVCPAFRQDKLIRDAANYVVDIFDQEGIVPYTNNPKDFGGGIHLWGFSSILSGLILANRVLKDNPKSIDRVIESVVKFIIDSGWNGKYFYPVVSIQGNKMSDVYMVRSDAWVFNNLASVLDYKTIKIDKNALVNILDRCYVMMHSVNFSGKESHASSLRTRFVGKIIKLFK
ncbi:hypothetical protein CPT03_16580 [Pedobacter ginsengisoli]|uniref:Uncharacterized protein n=1 Tax=Pedobacter ginsengisoli TaxID=363852 RepID=A0A2D1U8R7_9SPHI|nr:hypothetical protein [Pedobacter ginsengisoli]ATP57962.1 hypothetical protein CPT03_16580 [Pedobacter ginsengisoli]